MGSYFKHIFQKNLSYSVFSIITKKIILENILLANIVFISCVGPGSLDLVLSHRSGIVREVLLLPIEKESFTEATL